MKKKASVKLAKALRNIQVKQAVARAYVKLSENPVDAVADAYFANLNNQRSLAQQAGALGGATGFGVLGGAAGIPIGMLLAAKDKEKKEHTLSSRLKGGALGALIGGGLGAVGGGVAGYNAGGKAWAEELSQTNPGMATMYNLWSNAKNKSLDKKSNVFTSWARHPTHISSPRFTTPIGNYHVTPKGAKGKPGAGVVTSPKLKLGPEKNVDWGTVQVQKAPEKAVAEKMRDAATTKAEAVKDLGAATKAKSSIGQKIRTGAKYAVPAAAVGAAGTAAPGVVAHLTDKVYPNAFGVTWNPENIGTAAGSVLGLGAGALLASGIGGDDEKKRPGIGTTLGVGLLGALAGAGAGRYIGGTIKKSNAATTAATAAADVVKKPGLLRRAGGAIKRNPGKSTVGALVGSAALGGGGYAGYKALKAEEPKPEPTLLDDIARGALGSTYAASTLGGLSGAGIGSIVPYLLAKKDEDPELAHILLGAGIGGLAGAGLGYGGSVLYNKK